jgi:hypothetical protein
MLFLPSYPPKRVPHAIGIGRQKAIRRERETADERELRMGRHRMASQKYRDANRDAINVRAWARSAQ